MVSSPTDLYPVSVLDVLSTVLGFFQTLLHIIGKKKKRQLTWKRNLFHLFLSVLISLWQVLFLELSTPFKMQHGSKEQRLHRAGGCPWSPLGNGAA